ncbi:MULTISPECIES: NAD(P)H-dependent oxidoreductase [Methanobacterium]|uniref:NAD(P)H dehydrogenase n=1 Tax=Methanobacterium bryantii TaxID=2161 RepID=A0A2A2H6X8_METBR|nr:MULTISPECIES: NAD(P)H-dependent oxidoreductase [Methanobacterium]OEC84997.1 NAD(P)H dehydrogenase [Methanobacterium sp. A39]PAV05147.1 NAD(P)H dehydrogenase [Methanobacterium bryantii]
MNIIVILGHPTKGSFNHVIADTAVSKLRENGHEVIYHDLYAEKFDPLLSGEEIPKEAELDPLIEKHCREIKDADGIIIIHPNWWGQPPAILKGYVDRIIRAGVAYEFLEGDDGEGVPNGLLKAETALVFNTSNTPEIREREIFGDPLENIWKNCIFDLCGVKNFYREMYQVVVTSSLKKRHLWLENVAKTVELYFPPEK